MMDQSDVAQETDMLTLAAQFVNSTARHIFLTGKAGTGKTTFLLDLAKKTHKSFVIVAPTGIAALNAGGVTIHSQFLLPFGTFIPERKPAGDFSSATNFYTQHTLARSHHLNSLRKQVLRAVDLLIIDEVSMLRADILDAIDYRMRSVKGNFQNSFGGAQVLMIGDLYQLPPIVKDNEWKVLKNYYPSMHFFEAQGLKQDPFVYIELDKIFRQSDDSFIQILNNLRNNVATQKDVDRLNAHYKTAADISDEEEVITITTHNYKADAINEKKLRALKGASSFFEAEISKDFPEKLFPLNAKLELKEGAQIMFVKNDTSGEAAYYNGKLARVESIGKEAITVRMAGSNTKYNLRKEAWQHKKYSINEKSKELEEEIAGSFTQYPVKLAWAVTVHKSQGLTFDKAIIDVGEAFAPGQVYVALSRLRSLDGLILGTRINVSAISTDEEVLHFSNNRALQQAPDKNLHEEQMNYLQKVLNSTFSFSLIEQELAYLQKDKAANMEFEEESMRSAIESIQNRLKEEAENTLKFRRQLQYLFEQDHSEQLLERIEKGSNYYRQFIEERLNEVIVHQCEVEQFSRTKGYLNVLSEIDQLMMKKLAEMEKAAHLTQCVLSQQEITKLWEDENKRSGRRQEMLEAARKRAEEHPKNAKRKSGRKRKDGKKKEKGDTYKITYCLLGEGMSIKEVAKERNLTKGTIESHVTKGITAGVLSVTDYLDPDKLAQISKRMAPDKKLGEIYAAFKGKYSYTELKMAQAEVLREQK